jgi:D-alanyl-D-alanine carboxypeptidase/D-alanyl-D-alanine-endopeptidase (penicillin-binding protein 4)
MLYILRKNKWIASICFFIIAILFSKALFSQLNEVAAEIKALDCEIELLKKDACLKNSSWSICVTEISANTLIAGFNYNIVLEPASVMKIVSTSATLSILGGSYRFKTRLEYSGDIDTAGTLHGNLYITGGGDPTIGSQRFNNNVSADSVFAKFYKAMQTNNIKQVKGNIIADASVFEDNPASYSWLWEDIGNYYASGAYGLNIFENSYRLYFNAGNAVGERATLTECNPEMKNISFINHVTTGAANSGDNVVIFGGPYTNERLLEGTVPLGKKHFDVDGSIPDPPEFFAELFYEYLSDKGVRCNGYNTLRKLNWSEKHDSSQRKTLSEHFSPELSEIVIPTNIKSINLFSEAMLKMAGKLKKGTGSSDAGIEAIKDFLNSKKIDLKGFNMEDACGLSRKNKISTRQLCNILRAVKNENSFNAFYASLPVAGKSGGMAAMLKSTTAENNLRAKTGNMDKIKSYAGYVNNASGKELAFAIIFNNYTCSNAEIKQKAEKLMLLISQTK